MRARWIGPATLVTFALLTSAIEPGAVAAESAVGVVRVTAFDGSTHAESRIVDGRTVASSSRRGSVELAVDERLQLRVVEPGGQRVALATPLAVGADTYRPGGRASTRLVVADLGTGASRAYDVPRNVEPEAFGIGDWRDVLFVVDHRPALDPTSYRVGTVNLVNGDFRELYGPTKTPLDVDMTGHARQQIPSADGTQLYTLYLEHDHTSHPPHDHASTGPTGTAFVHVLDLAGGWAYCVDLPGVGHGPAGSSTIRLARGGGAILVTDRHAGTRHSIPTADLESANLSSGAAPRVALRTLRT